MNLVTNFILIVGLIAGTTQCAWYDNAVFYQIYPQSFKESKGELKGNGDLKGVIEKLDYLQDLGVDAIWLNPIYVASTHGYDVIDYKKIDPKYGTVEDFANLTKEANLRNIRIIMDFVPNHVSHEHEWFQKSIKKIGNFTDYFIWNDGIVDPTNSSNRLPPNNWLRIGAQNGESAWQWNDERNQFFFFQFAPGMPDLNLRNENVQRELIDAFKFWLDLGINGWRIDAISHGFEDEELRDEELKDKENGNKLKWDDYDHKYTNDLNETFKIVYSWRKFMDDYQKEKGGEERLIMTESYTEVKRFQQDPDDPSIKGAHLPFFFNMIFDLNDKSNAKDFVEKVYNRAPKNTAWVIGNHDQSRTADRVGKDRINIMNVLLLLIGRATVTYYGEEIGMNNVCNVYNSTTKRYRLCEPSDKDLPFWQDNYSRTPFQWDDTKNAGFSDADETLYPVSPNYTRLNLKYQQECLSSNYYVYKDLVQLKKSEYFDTEDLNVTIYSDNVLWATKKFDNKFTTVLINMNGTSNETVVLNGNDAPYTVIYSIKPISQYDIGNKLTGSEDVTIQLSPYDILVLTTSNSIRIQIGLFVIFLSILTNIFI
jgi:alpha-glucosidase